MSNDEHVKVLREIRENLGANPRPVDKPDADALEAAIRTLSAQQSEAVAWCAPDDPINATAFAWPGTARDASRHTMPLYAAQPQGAVSDEERDAWRDLVRRAWQLLDVECPNDEITAELFAALRPDAGESADVL